MGKEEKPDNPKEQANTESRNAEDIERAIDALAHVLQRHLLMFAYTTYAYRFNPAVRKSPYGEPVEYISAWDLSICGEEDDGDFLLESENERLLMRYLEGVWSKFGRGKGKRPTTQTVGYDEEKDRVTVTHEDIEGGSFPAWHLSYDQAHYYLERITGAVLDAVTNLRKADILNRFNEIADFAGDVAQPAGHPTWAIPSTKCIEENIPWEYPQQVLEVASRVRDAKSQVFKRYPKKAKVEKEKTKWALLWKLYETTLKILVDAFMDKFWAKPM
ncbi:MAG: hypothetical protein JXM79_26060 [Sedimentisphaerales bacterium]|nr:hypothetical protein [Sedimentisphaerales bacterium]